MNDTVSEWTALIADDEPAARRGVRQLLAAFPQFRVSGECVDGAQVLSTLDILRPDVVFLDVQMPGVDGFEVIRRRTPERMPIVVFLTAYDQFAIRAFEAEALDYLLKPVSEARFAAAMRRVMRQLHGTPKAGTNGRILVPTSRGTVVLHVQEIDWIAAEDNYSRLWVDGQSYLIRESLASLEERFRASGFARAHRGALIRLAAVQRLLHGADGECTAQLRSGARVPVSRRRRVMFVEALRAGESAR